MKTLKIVLAVRGTGTFLLFDNDNLCVCKYSHLFFSKKKTSNITKYYISIDKL